jgi:hypothetical protein
VNNLDKTKMQETIYPKHASDSPLVSISACDTTPCPFSRFFGMALVVVCEPPCKPCVEPWERCMKWRWRRDGIVARGTTCLK